MEDDRLLTERILILIRNILDIPITPDDEKRTDDDASVHDMVASDIVNISLENVTSGVCCRFCGRCTNQA